MKTNAVLILLDQIKSQDILVAVIEQLNKDILLSGLDIKIDTSISAKQLVAELYGLFYKLIRTDFGSYLNVLYRIDVPEKALKSITATEPELIVEQVALLVVQRELQKVSFKNKIR